MGVEHTPEAMTILAAALMQARPHLTRDWPLRSVPTCLDPLNLVSAVHPSINNSWLSQSALFTIMAGQLQLHS